MIKTLVPINVVSNDFLRRGFTLLELLLVLVLLTTITVSGLGMYEIKLRNFKVDKTALQMQQWLQAGLAFYTDCQKWPADSDSDSNMLSAMMGKSAYTKDECAVLENKIRIYMPEGSDHNAPWSYYDSQGNFVQAQYHIGPVKNPDGSDSDVFSVSTIIGYDKSLQTSANMIAGRLPNATTSEVTPVGQKPVWVQAYVNSTGGGSINNGPYIVDMQNIGSGQTSHIATHYQCPEGMEYKVFSGLSNVYAGPSPDGVFIYGVNKTNVNVPLTGDKIKPNLRSIGNCTDPSQCYNDGPDNQLLLISACMPKSSAKPYSTINTSSSSLGNNYARY